MIASQLGTGLFLVKILKEDIKYESTESKEKEKMEKGPYSTELTSPKDNTVQFLKKIHSRACIKEHTQKSTQLQANNWMEGRGGERENKIKKRLKWLVHTDTATAFSS